MIVEVRIELSIKAEADSLERVLHTIRVFPNRAVRFRQVNGDRVKLMEARAISTSVERKDD